MIKSIPTSNFFIILNKLVTGIFFPKNKTKPFNILSKGFKEYNKDFSRENEIHCELLWLHDAKEEK